MWFISRQLWCRNSCEILAGAKGYFHTKATSVFRVFLQVLDYKLTNRLWRGSQTTRNGTSGWATYLSFSGPGSFAARRVEGKYVIIIEISPLSFFSWSVMTSSNGNIFRVTGHLCGDSPVTGEFPAKRQVTRSFYVFFDLRPNKPVSKQSWGWWFETLSRPLWHHCNALCFRLFGCPFVRPYIRPRGLRYYVENVCNRVTTALEKSLNLRFVSIS